MKKILVGLFLVVAIGGIFYLVQAGIITWQPLTMIVAALMAPFKFIMGLFGSEEKIRAKFQAERDAEHEWQQQLGERVKEREEKVVNLRKEIEELDAQKVALKKDMESVRTQVENMSTEEKIKKGKDLLG